MKPHFLNLALTVLLSWGGSILPIFMAGPGSTAAAADILSYTLMNADTNGEIMPLTPGMTLDFATLPTRNLNIRANTSDGPVGSVVFNLTGPENRTSTENIAPYALFSDFQGDYFPWTPPLGEYRLLATPYDGPDGTGTTGAPLTLRFTVTSTIAAVVTYTLVNADTDTDIQPLSPGATLNLAALPTRNLNVRANPNALPVSSVKFTLSLAGSEIRNSVENIPPYALFSDLAGNYDPWTPAVGNYVLIAVPFDGLNGTGNAGVGLTIAFSVVDAPLPVQLSAFSAEVLHPDAVLVRWSTATEVNNKEFVVERSLDGNFFAALSTVPGHGSTSQAQNYRYEDKQLPAQTATLYYRLRQVDIDGKTTFSSVRTVALQARGPAAALLVYSDPTAGGKVQYSFTGPTAGNEVMDLYSITGQRQGQYRVAATGAGHVPVAGLPSGVYVLRIVTATGSHTGRFVLP